VEELKIDPSKMEAILKWTMPTNVFEVMGFIGVAQYLKKFITLFSAIAGLLHTITTCGKSF